MDELKIEQYVPVDKSWIIRLGVLDILNGQDTIKQFVDSQPGDSLPDDVRYTRLAGEDWPKNRSIRVGESGTLYRALQFADWLEEGNRHFVKSGTLAERDICDDPAIMNFSTEELLELDNETSQWATAAVLSGSDERIDNPPPKLALTYEAVEHWQAVQEASEPWEPRQDETIRRQAEAFAGYITRGVMDFEPRHSEDFCFAYVFGLVSAEKGEKRWPSLLTHESNRINEMKKGVDLLYAEGRIESRDHRVVQSLGLLAVSAGISSKTAYPNSVSKSWPRFREFLFRTQRLLGRNLIPY